MEIVVGVNNVAEAPQLISAGASLLYCGVLDPSWISRFPGASLGINRRPYFRECNLDSMSAVAMLVSIAHRMRARVALTVNEQYYSDAQEMLLRHVIADAAAVGVDALIVSDLGLLSFAKDAGWRGQIHVSTTASVYNWKAAELYFARGADRIILPRHLTLREIPEITRRTPGSYEAFVMNSGCFYDDGMCGCAHFFHLFTEGAEAGGACALTWVRAGSSGDDPPFSAPKSSLLACGACAVADLARAGIGALKIVGREFAPEKKLRDVRFIRRVIDVATSNGDQVQAASSRARELYARYYGQVCSPHQCYYEG